MDVPGTRALYEVSTKHTGEYLSVINVSIGVYPTLVVRLAFKIKSLHIYVCGETQAASLAIA